MSKFDLKPGDIVETSAGDCGLILSYDGSIRMLYITSADKFGLSSFTKEQLNNIYCRREIASLDLKKFGELGKKLVAIP